MPTLITRSEMFELLLVADPSFRSRWDAFLAEWSEEEETKEDGLPLYLAQDSLAEHLIQRLGAGDTDGFDAVFDVVERWHVEGDAYVSEAASIGLLESLQNQLGGDDRRYKTRKGVRASDFERWLRPETRKWWDKLYRFWGGDNRALRFDS
ncbi:MAG: hypothetical protein WC729_03970 [Sphingomonas sp.]|jgi:hypothetical protein|uniref:DUF7674 family protein n=1 Tax=Sphingomonas sp. TaxID=28214 RepID=UPI00356A0BC5